MQPPRARLTPLPSAAEIALVAAAMTIGSLPLQGFAAAACADGVAFPPGGHALDALPSPAPYNWSPNAFSAATGSIFIPDVSLFERNDPGQPLTGGGHDWVFDQGSSLCRTINVGKGAAPAAAWSLPHVNAAECVLLPAIRRGANQGFDSSPPYQGSAITPTCNPAALSPPNVPNPANTYLNQLGCSISHGAATIPQTANSYIFVAGIRGGLFAVPLQNAVGRAVGDLAGKIAGPAFYYSDLPEGLLLTNASVSPDGRFVIATSIRGRPQIYACLNPLGNPGDPEKPIDLNFFFPPRETVHCMAVGAANLSVILSNDFGPDAQPYFGGPHSVTSFNPVPGGDSNAAWPNCIWRPSGSPSLSAAFANHRANGCGGAQPNAGLSLAGLGEPQAIITHNDFIYIGYDTGSVAQIRVSVDKQTGLSRYASRIYATGLPFVTGLGVAENQRSLVVFGSSTPAGAGPAVVTKLPLCEDMQ